ncbi:cytochrome P450 [Streptomyces sp. S465]|uniref:cytochrome P450 n=1 Tax=Streptomyces sp. S465 TaxID=2979468 RepID=UPI0022A8A420|nr:cytochrome P450 [Streptomyces sp. S465]WAP57768.1 cytochrome P450 [Streptomyces sp. S465]
MRLTRPTGTEPIDLAHFDLVDPALHGEGDPHAIWHAMREREPVPWQQVTPKLGFWSATKFDDVARVLRDHHVFTSEHGTLLNLLGKKDPASRRQLPATDPPRHTRMRSPIQRALNAKVLDRHRPLIRNEIKYLFGDIVDGEPFDFAELTGKLPMAVTGTLMGLDREHWPRLTYLTSQAIAPDDPEFITPAGSRGTLQLAHRQLFATFEEAMAQRKGDGNGDLIDVLRTMDFEDGRKLQPGEIVSNCYSLLLGANVTTPHVPNGAMIELLENGGYDDWATHPELLESGIEEALRWTSPATHFMRYAKQDVTLSGVTIRTGEPIVAWLGSANRDVDVFPDPYTFDIRRNAKRHLAFGIGPHFCVGHAVARLTLQEFFTELFDQFEKFEQVGEAEHLHSNFIAGVKHLPLVATRRRR